MFLHLKEKKAFKFWNGKKSFLQPKRILFLISQIVKTLLKTIAKA